MRQVQTVNDVSSLYPFKLVGPPGLEPEANLLPNHFSYPTAFELQTDYTRYDTVFNSDAAQYAQFSVRAWRLTF